MSGSGSKNLLTFLAKVPFFTEVDLKSLKQLEKVVTVRDYGKNITIFKKGDEGHSMFVILEGSVKVHDKQHEYDQLTTSDCFGEYALIDEQSRSASITTLEHTKVAEVQRDDFVNLMANDIGFSQGVLAVMIKRHRELDHIQERLASSKEALELASSKMNGLIEGAMDAIVMFDEDYRIVLTNPSANKMFENTDVIQRNVLYFLDDDGANLIESIIEKAKDKGRINTFIPDVITVIGSEDTSSLNEGTLSSFSANDRHYFTLILRNIEERLQAEDTIELLTKQTRYLEEEIKELTSEYGIIAEDAKMKDVLKAIDQVGKTDATVLITGETGTGKELVARAIHQSSHRNDRPLIRINCGAIPHNLIESELFGHVKGAFTGATADRKGRFLLADEGTIFLDEIGELPLELQPKLLRVIQEGEFDPIGSSETTTVDVRIIAATHRDLLDHAQKGKFREDLFYRLNVFPIVVPPLRTRGEDLILIAEEMIEKFSKKLSKPVAELTEYDKDLLRSYDWPGNVRELQNLVERAVIISSGKQVDWSSILPSNSQKRSEETVITNQKILTSQELLDFEKENILKALKQTKWKISGKNGAAELLKMRPTTLSSRIKALGIERPV